MKGKEIRKVFANVSRPISSGSQLRFYTNDIFGGIVFALLTVENIGFLGYNLIVLVGSCILGFAAGFYEARTVTRGIEKTGEFRRALKPLLLVAALAVLIVSLSLYGLALGVLSFAILSSGFAFAPTMFLGRSVVSWRWEQRNHKEIQPAGFWRATLYAIPQGLTAVEKYKCRWERQQRLHQNSG